MKSIFIRNITHEINTPLNAIVGFSELASMQDADPAERATYIDIIHENSGNLSKLVDDVLYISDLESSEERPERTETNIAACCTQAVTDVQDVIPAPRAIRFENQCGRLRARVPRPLIIKVLRELLLNAVRFAPEGEIVLGCYAAADGKGDITFTVTDSGPGIPCADAERIFGRFVKLDAFGQGMGLGLSVCRLIADTLGGEIRLDTSYTAGTRFVFTIPNV